jgi:hypothetical protein
LHNFLLPCLLIPAASIAVGEEPRPARWRIDRYVANRLVIALGRATTWVSIVAARPWGFWEAEELRQDHWHQDSDTPFQKSVNSSKAGGKR